MNALPQKRVRDGNEWRSVPWKPKSQKNHHVNIGAFLRWAAKMEYIPRVPAMPPAPIVPKVRIRYYSDREQQAVLAALPDLHRPIFEFMAWCGCRSGEARALRRQDVNLEGGFIMIQAAFNRSGELSTTKTKKMRPLPVDDTVRPILEAAMKAMKIYSITAPTPNSEKSVIDAFIFPNPETGQPYDERELRYRWWKAVKAAGVRDLGVTEGTRKTVATRLINKGVTKEMIADMLGNSPKVLDEHYAQITASRYAGLLGSNAQSMPKRKKENAND